MIVGMLKPGNHLFQAIFFWKHRPARGGMLAGAREGWRYFGHGSQLSPFCIDERWRSIIGYKFLGNGSLANDKRVNDPGVPEKLQWQVPGPSRDVSSHDAPTCCGSPPPPLPTPCTHVQHCATDIQPEWSPPSKILFFKDCNSSELILWFRFQSWVNSRIKNKGNVFQ